MATFHELAASEKGHLRITALKAVQIKGPSQSLIKVETDAGIVGYGEAGGPGPMIRGNLRYFEPFLLGQDPLEIDKLFNVLVNLQHPSRPHIPTVSGVNIALWDIAGKVFRRPISQLFRGQWRTEIPLYVNTPGPRDWFDKGACREWAQQIKEHPYGWTTIKMDFGRLLGTALPKDVMRMGHRSVTFRVTDLKIIGKGYENCREALDPSIDMIVHCHNELDLPTALGLAHAVASIGPRWLEDALPVPYSDAWKALKAASPVPIITGEKLELTREFLPFLANQAVDVIHPDIVYAGGFTGLWQIAELADLFYVPVATHNVGSVLHSVITAHFGASTRNFVVSETALGTGYSRDDLIEQKLEVVNSKLRLPTGPGLGITVVEEAVRAHMIEGEPYWG